MKNRFNPLFQIVAILSLAVPAHAAIFYWDGNSTSANADGGVGNWDTALTNWDTLATAGADIAWPSVTTLDDDAVFGGTTGTVTVDAAGVTANSLTFNTANYILQGGKITLNGTTPTIANSVAATINSEIGGAAGLTKTGAGILTLGAANSYTGATSISGGTLVVARTNAINTASTVNISTTSGAGTLRLATDTSVSALAIGGSSSFQGTIVSDRATAGVGITHVLGAAGLGTSTYNFQAGSNVTSGAAGISFASLNLSAGGSGTTTLNPTTANLTIVGAVGINTGGTTKTLGLGGTSTGNSINGVISNGSVVGAVLSLTKSNTSTWTLTGANTYGGATLISGGTLQLGNGGATGKLPTGSAISNNANLTINRSNAVVQGTDFSSASITGSGSFTQAGSGTTTLNVTNGYTGATNVTGGILRVTGSTHASSAVAVSAGALGGNGTVNGAVTVSSTGGINLADGAVGTLTLGNTLDITGAAGANNLRFDLANAGSTTDQLSVSGTTSVTTTGAAVISFNQLGGPTNRLTAGTYTLIGGAGTLDATNFAKFSLATNKAFGQTFTLSNPSANNGDLAVTTTQVTAATAAAFWKGGAVNWSTASNWNSTVAGGAAAAGAPDYQTNVTFATTTPTPATLTTNIVDTDFDINSLTFNSLTGGVTIGGTKMLTLEATNANSNTAGNGITSSNTSGTNAISAKIGLAANQTWTVGTGGTLVASGGVSDFGAGYTLTKAGSGTLALSGTNTYTGTTTVTTGTLKIGNGSTGGSLSTSSDIAIGTGATLQIDRSNAVTQGVDFTMAPIAGLGKIVKSSAGTLTLNGANTFSGGLTINSNGGSVQIDTPGAQGSGTITLSKQGSQTGILKLNTSGTNVYTNTFASMFSSAGSAIGGSPNIQNLQGDNTISSNLTINNAGGTGVNLQSDAGILRISGTLSNTVSGNRPFDFSGAGNGVFSGVMSQSTGTTAILKNGSGTWSITGTNSSFTGGVSVLQGVLNVASVADTGFNSSIGAGGPINLTGQGTSGTLQYTGSSAVATNHALTVATTGGTLDASGTGGGTLIFSGAFTATDPGTFSLNFTNGSNVATNTAVTTAGTVGGNVMSVSATGLIGGTTITSISGNSYTLSNPFTGATAAVATTFGAAVARTLTLTGSNTGANEISSTLADSAGGGVLSIAKSGEGTWVVSGANTHSGATTLSAGTLLANNSTGSATGAGTVTVNGGTLGGTGSISGAVTINTTGVLSPGASIESLATGALTLNSGSTFAYELNTTGLGTADLVDANGNLDLNGTVTLSLTDLGFNSLLALGTKFAMISYFGSWTPGDIFTGYADDSNFTMFGNEWQINYDDTTAGSVNGGAFTNAVTLTVIPEPNAAMLVGGLGLLGLLRRRR